MFIPESVESNQNLSPDEKYLYGLILNNVETDGICYHVNPYQFFATATGRLTGKSERTVRRYVKNLEKEGLIGFVSNSKIKNAIYVVNESDYKHEDNNFLKSNKVSTEIVAIIDKFVKECDKITEDSEDLNPILKLIYGICNLVLVSNENKNINNNSAGARVHSVSNNLNKFANYEQAGKQDRVRYFDFETRKPYMQVLFGDFFAYHSSGSLYEEGKVVVDTMLEAYEQSRTERGFIFNHKTYKAQDLLGLYLNITTEEFASIINNVANNKEIYAKSCYIMGAIIQAGERVNWKKTSHLVSRGYPWDTFVPGQNPLRDVVIKTQQRIEREKSYQEFAKEYVGLVPNAEKIVRGTSSESQRATN